MHTTSKNKNNNDSNEIIAEGIEGNSFKFELEYSEKQKQQQQQQTATKKKTRRKYEKKNQLHASVISRIIKFNSVR